MSRHIAGTCAGLQALESAWNDLTVRVSESGPSPS